MPEQSLALVLDHPHAPPELEQVTIDEPGSGEVRVRLVASGVCHTDISNVRDARYWPVVLGHEGAGVVESVGADVRDVQVGDHVIISWRVPCGSYCRPCLSGRQDLCEKVRTTSAPRIHRSNGAPLHVLLNAGTFCGMSVIPAGGAIPIRKDMPLDRAALIGCAVATGVGAALHTAQVQAGESVAIFGVGGIGLNIVQGARLARAGIIIAIDLIGRKLELARHLGATHIVRAGEQDAVQAILDLTNGRGIDHAFESVGHPSVMQQALQVLSPGGTLTFVGAAARDATFVFHPRAFLSKQQTMRGCIYGSVRPAIDFPLFVEWYMNGMLRLDELLSETIGIEQLPDKFKKADSTGAIRTVVKFGE